MNILFFSSHTFLTKEILNVLSKKYGNQYIIVDIPQYPTPNQISSIFEQMQPFLPGLVLAINDAGFDFKGTMSKKLIAAGCLIVNWYHDYPFYEEVFMERIMEPSKFRIDFVTEESFLPEMQERGFTAHFLPLATDPYFFKSENKIELVRDIAFVGNSSTEFLDSIMTEERIVELEKLLSIQVEAKRRYRSDSRFDVNQYLLQNKNLWSGKTSLKDREVIFCIEWMIGYLFRRDFIKSIAAKYKQRFTCYGDPYWRNFMDPLQVSTEACYYTNLCNIYRSTKVNINVNRIQIRTSFTQRIFDCAASGAFIITDRRKCNQRYFNLSGPERELVEFDSLEQCCKLIDYYLDHEDERKQIADAAHKKVMKYHTYENRINEMLEICKSHWGL